MLEHDLKQFGLDENEAKLYLTLLELGPSTVTELTTKAQITRTLGYKILDDLGLLGLVTRVSGSGKKMKFAAEHPRSFVQFVKNKKNQWERNIIDAEDLLPDLISLYKVKDKPVIRYQEGVRGVISLFEESLESKTEILSVTDVESWQEPEFWDWAKSYNRERNKRKVKERILLLDTPEGRKWLTKYRSTPYTIYRWVTPEHAKGLLEFGGELNIYENKVIIAQPRRPHRLAALIESSVLSNILRSLFEITWEIARPIKIDKKR